ncbi:MAG: ABC transporter permease [Akkermansiaceae bacterium]|nr:ABC transporter permease [Akkermansiaceae bacterium]
MRQILTILWDSYRLLAAKKLFWVVLFLTLLIAMTYASVGFTPQGISVLFGAYHIESDVIVEGSIFAEYLYMMLFTDYLVPLWLGLFALVLALISVCPVFPDFLTAGSIDVAISKPMSRVTLFLVKYLGSLLFVAIQVFVFCLIVFIAHGVRMNAWNLEIFWAVLLLTFVFSLIYSVAVLTAVWTRSTLFSLLMALLVWGVTLAVQWTESVIYKFTYVAPASGLSVDIGDGQTRKTGEQLEVDEGMEKFYRIVKAIGTPLPKTRDATYLLKNKVTVRGKNMTKMSEFLEAGATPQEQREAKAMEDYDNRHSAAYIIGTSLAFEFCILGVACWMFARKDF